MRYILVVRTLSKNNIQMNAPAALKNSINIYIYIYITFYLIVTKKFPFLVSYFLFTNFFPFVLV